MKNDKSGSVKQVKSEGERERESIQNELKKGRTLNEKKRKRIKMKEKQTFKDRGRERTDNAHLCWHFSFK